MKRLEVGLFFVCMMAGLFSCKKEQLIVEKDDTNAVLNVSIQTTVIQAEPFDMRYTSAGWMVFQEDQSPYLSRLDTQGHLIGQGNPTVKGVDYYGEMLVEGEAGKFYRCTNASNDPTKVVIQELDADYTLIQESEILDEQATLRISGFKYVGAGSFVFSVDNGNSSVPSKIYFYEGLSKSLLLLSESKNGFLLDYYRTPKGFQYIAVKGYTFGTPASVLILDNVANQLWNIPITDYVGTQGNKGKGKFHAGSSGTVFIYSSKTLLSSIVIDGYTNQLSQLFSSFEVPYFGFDLLDFQVDPSGVIWMLGREINGSPTRELVLSKYTYTGKVIWSRTLSGTSNIAGLCRLRLYGTHSFGKAEWQILGSGSRYQSTALTLINP